MFQQILFRFVPFFSCFYSSVSSEFFWEAKVKEACCASTASTLLQFRCLVSKSATRGSHMLPPGPALQKGPPASLKPCRYLGIPNIQTRDPAVSLCPGVCCFILRAVCIKEIYVYASTDINHNTKRIIKDSQKLALGIFYLLQSSVGVLTLCYVPLVTLSHVPHTGSCAARCNLSWMIVLAESWSATHIWFLPFRVTHQRFPARPLCLTSVWSATPDFPILSRRLLPFLIHL